MVAGRRSEFLARSEGRIVVAAALLATILFGALALLRHWSFHSTASDLAVFDQVVWNTVHGRFMESTISLARCEPHSFFGDHFSPALLLLVPAYIVFPHPETLIVVQTIALVLGVWPIHLLARRFLLTSEKRLVWVAAYLLSAPLSFIALYDFHEITLAVAPLGFALYFLATRRTGPMILCLVVALLAKEEVALIGVGFGVALAFQGRWRSSAVVIVGSILAFVVTLQVIIPAFAEGAPYHYLGRYASLGRDEGEIARTLLLDPLRVLSVLVSGEIGSKVVFVLSLFGPGLGLASVEMGAGPVAAPARVSHAVRLRRRAHPPQPVRRSAHPTRPRRVDPWPRGAGRTLASAGHRWRPRQQSLFRVFVRRAAILVGFRERVPPRRVEPRAVG